MLELVFRLVKIFPVRGRRTMVVLMEVEVVHSVMVTVLLPIFVLLIPMMSLLLGFMLLPTIGIPLISLAMAMLSSRLLPMRLVILVIIQVFPRFFLLVVGALAILFRPVLLSARGCLKFVRRDRLLLPRKDSLWDKVKLPLDLIRSVNWILMLIKELGFAVGGEVIL